MQGLLGVHLGVEGRDCGTFQRSAPLSVLNVRNIFDFIIFIIVVARIWRNGNPFTLSVGMESGAAVAENGRGVHKKVKDTVPIWSSLFKP